MLLHCPQVKNKPNTRHLTTEDESQPVDPWVLSVTAEDDSRSSTDTLHLRGPAYKVIVQCPHTSLNRLWSSGNLGPEPDVVEDKGEAWLDNRGMSFTQQAT